MRQGRDKSIRETPEEIWEQIEVEFGPLNHIPDDILRQRLATEQRIHGDQFVPAEIFVRVVTDVLARNRQNVLPSDRPQLMEIERLLRRLSKRIRAEKARPAHRPRMNWFSRQMAQQACRELEQRRRELMWETDEQGKKRKKLSSFNALRDAAREIAPNYFVKPKTLLSWRANPKRLHLRWRSRPRK